MTSELEERGKNILITIYTPNQKTEYGGDMKRFHQALMDLGKQSWEAVGYSVAVPSVQQVLFKREVQPASVDTQPGPATIELTAEVAERLAEVLEEMKK
ncbi:MAG: hypothetical protein GTO14_03145 [Anaerolineales bacterium]|nr:hypothetical protein [Anaerolineales bacterium]